MTNLRILKKRDGSFITQQCTGVVEGIWTWENIPIVEEPEAEKSLEQTMYEAWMKACGSHKTWECETEKWKGYYRIEAQAAEQYLLSKGWRRP